MTGGPVRPVVELRNTAKRYGAMLAVDDVSLRVEPGEIYALLGLNGAGKTTLIRMLLGMVRPTRGSVALFDRPLSDGRTIWPRVGYLVESPAAYPELTVRENLDLVRRWRHLPDPASVDAALDRLRLTGYAGHRAHTLSLGNAQRLGLAKALLHQPDLLVLDEPANGLDPAGVVEIRDLLRRLADAGTTVFLSSHVLAEVARLATRIGIIHQGRLLQQFPADDLDHRVRRWLTVATRDNDHARQALTAAGYRIAHQDGLLTTRDRRAVAEPDAVAATLVAAGCPPTKLLVEQEDLETYFLRAVGAYGA